jgi:hypothetical protein
MPELRLLFVCGFYYGLYRLIRRLRRSRNTGTSASWSPAGTQPAPQPELPASPAPSTGELATIADWAFDYERAVIAADVPPSQADRTLYAINRLVVPLVGHVRICELDDELVRSVSRVLAAQLREDQAREAAQIWVRFVGWARYHAAPAERRNIWTLLDPQVQRTYDEFTDS